MAVDYLQKILTAKVYDVAIESPLEYRAALSQRLGNRDSAQARGRAAGVLVQAARRLQQDGATHRGRARQGVIAASAGNHAQGVALAAQRLGCEATIVMPVTTPQIKIAGGRGARREGRAARRLLLRRLRARAGAAAKTGAAFVHPYDDPDVIAGQGTIGMEILRQCQGPLDAIFVAVGGGGLIAGIAAYVKRVRPEVRIIGVQPVDSDAMTRSLAAGRRVTLPHVGSVRRRRGGQAGRPGDLSPRAPVRRRDDLVDTDATCAAIKDVFEDTRSILEPAGALAIAGRQGLVRAAPRARPDLRRDRLRREHELRPAALRRRAGRTRRGSARRSSRSPSPSARAAFASSARLLGKRNDHRVQLPLCRRQRTRTCSSASRCRGRRETARTCWPTFRRHRIEAYDLSDNEMAKLHVRHLVGGHAPAARNEILYRFEFPERPGALMRFLDSMSAGWNISLFHYRNHGADYGRVLVGMQVPPRGQGRFPRSFWTGSATPTSTRPPIRRTGCSSAAERGPDRRDARRQTLPQRGSPACMKFAAMLRF